MLERRHVVFYARSGGVPEDRAERDVVLTYVLRVLRDGGLLPYLGFKGGTCLKKVYLGKTGRFSMDLDFTAVDVDPQTLREKVKDLLHGESQYDIGFEVREENLSPESYYAAVNYSHEWSSSVFELQVSFREKPVLPLLENELIDEMYFKYCEFKSFPVRCLQRDEVLSEKIRAMYQRASSRDLYDLFLFCDRPYDRERVKNMVLVKCWNVRDAFDPEGFFERVESGGYDWTDLERLVRRGSLPGEEEVVGRVLDGYGYLRDLDEDLLRVSRDSYAHREKAHVSKLIEDIRARD